MGDVSLVCKCDWHMKGNKTFVLSEITLGMCLSHVCQKCAARQYVTGSAWHPGDVLILVLQKDGRTESSDLCTPSEPSFMTQFLHGRKATEKCIYN